MKRGTFFVLLVAILVVAFASSAFGAIWNYEKDFGAINGPIKAGALDYRARTNRIYDFQNYAGAYQYGAAGSGNIYMNKVATLQGTIGDATWVSKYGASYGTNAAVLAAWGQPYWAMADVAGGPANTTGPNKYVYLKWDAVKAGGGGLSPVDANTGSPHGGYVSASIKCAVCHSAHTAAPGGAPVGAAGATADTLLRTKAADACAFCHVASGSTVMDPVFGGVWPVPAEAGHSLGGNNCAECHTGPHGAGAETIPPLNGKLLTLATDYAPSTVISRVTAIEASAAAQGFGTRVTGFTAAEYQDAAVFAANPGMKDQAVGVFCGGCHEGSYASTIANASASNMAGTQAGKFSGHRTMASVTTTWNATGAKKSSGYKSNIKIADAPATGCTSCHDADNGYNTGTKAFPHNWGVVTGETIVYDAGLNEFENQTFAWLLKKADSTSVETTVGGVAGKTAHAGATGGTLSDGVCLKCHKWTAGGVGATF